MAKPSVRDKIVDAALDRFHTLGFSACSVQDIVDTAGVPKGSFYNYFKAKELLALEVLSIYGKDCNRQILSDTSLPPIDRLRGHFEFMAAHYAEFGYEKGCLIANLAAEVSDNTPLLRQAIGQSLDKWTSAVAITLHEGQLDGSIVPTLDAEKMARFLINSWEGAVVRMKIVRCGQPLEDFFAVAFPLLLTRPTVQ